ncbi:MAG: hypothetical protein WBN40_00280, partial [Pseudomonadales bacterium]
FPGDVCLPAVLLEAVFTTDFFFAATFCLFACSVACLDTRLAAPFLAGAGLLLALPVTLLLALRLALEAALLRALLLATTDFFAAALAALGIAFTPQLIARYSSAKKDSVSRT